MVTVDVAISTYEAAWRRFGYISALLFGWLRISGCIGARKDGFGGVHKVRVKAGSSVAYIEIETLTTESFI